MDLEYNEQELVSKALAGNLESLSRLLHYNYNKVYGYMVTLTFNNDLASDLTQEAFTKAIARLDQYNPDKAAFSTWLVQIAINTCKDWYRKEKRQKVFLQNIEHQASYLPKLSLIGTGLGINTSISGNHESILDMQIALQNMKPKFRMPIILKYYYGYEQNEIAHMLKIPTGTVKSRIFNGLKKLRKELGNSE